MLSTPSFKPRIHWMAILVLSGTFFTPMETDAQPADTLYDESKVPAYTLPDPLKFADGQPVGIRRAWPRRRAEILELFRSEVYGRSPGAPAKVDYVVTQPDTPALDGLAIRREVSIVLTPDTHAVPLKIQVLLYLPKDATGPTPVFLGLNFNSNASIHPDPDITLTKRWMRNNPSDGVEANRATEAIRGTANRRWPVETILKRGYGLATVYYGDIEPDHAEGWRTGVRAVFPAPSTSPSPSSAAQSVVPLDKPLEKLAPDAWGAIAAWAWGLSRVVDYFETDTAIDAKRIALLGHSRLGKTALWAGAEDPRFAVVISNNSGEGGASLARRLFGERTHHLNKSFPHWFNAHFKRYDLKEETLPVDQHQLIALSAPRPVYIASAEQDRWADPKGEFLSAVGADPVYQLLGQPGLQTQTFPAINEPVGSTLRYHVRSGAHDVTAYDWEQYLGFADQWMKSSTP